jgi:acid phosphatase family membrane protein YuiD
MEEWVERGQYIIVVTLGWAVAQSIKIVLKAIKTLGRDGIGVVKTPGFGRKLLSVMWTSGGMPSAHTSVVVALASYVGLVNGFDSALFGVALCFAMVVAYDAVKVRYAVGRNALALNKIIDQGNHKVDTVKIVKGHTIAEAIAGFFLGLLIGFSTFILLGGDVCSIFADF